MRPVFELHPQYQHLKRTGVYLMNNSETGKVYIGSAATSFRSRWISHLSKLRNGDHANQLLQNAWNKHGESAFQFRVVVICAPKDCVFYEQRFIDHFESAERGRGYNIAPTAGSLLGYRMPRESVERRAAKQRGKKASAEHRAKIAAANTGHKHSAEARRKQSEAAKKRRASHETRAKMSVAHKNQSAETRAKISAASVGRKHTDEWRKLQSARNAERWKSPEARARQSEALKRARRTAKSWGKRTKKMSKMLATQSLPSPHSLTQMTLLADQ